MLRKSNELDVKTSMKKLRDKKLLDSLEYAYRHSMGKGFKDLWAYREIRTLLKHRANRRIE